MDDALAIDSETASEHQGDADIIARSQKGEKQAFGQLVQKYMRRAYYSALGLVGSHEAALDLSQEAFVRAYRNIRKFDARKSFFTWYYQILRNLCLNHLRDRSRQARSFSDVGEVVIQKIPDESFNAAAQMEQNEVQRLVWLGLNKIQAHEREIILLRDFQGMSYKEIAETLDIPLGTVMSRLYGARQALKTHLKSVLDE